jgi:hypothetical protein
MQKLSDDIWAEVYKDYMQGHSLSHVFWGNEVLIDAHHTPKAFTAAFHHYIDRNKLPERD